MYRKNLINDESIDVISTLFRLIHEFKYEDAYCHLIENTDNTMVNSKVKEWVKALCEFYVYKQKNEAVRILEHIRPNEIHTEIDLRIISSLLCFYNKVNNSYDFYKLVKFTNEYLKNNNCVYIITKIKMLYNMSNGFYAFQDYNNAIKYAGYCIDESTINQNVTMLYALSLFIRIASFYTIDNVISAKSELNLYNDYKYLIGNIDHLVKDEVNKIKKYMNINILEC